MHTHIQKYIFLLLFISTEVHFDFLRCAFFHIETRYEKEITLHKWQ